MKKNKAGKESDSALLEVIKRNQGLSQYELARKLAWNIGKVDGAVRRLLRENKIIISVVERNGRNVNLVFSSDYKPSKVIEVPTSLLHVGNPLWLDSAYLYALDSVTVGISGKETPEWAEVACFQEKIPIQRTEEKVVLQIPEKIRDFYDIERRQVVVSVNGNNLLVTISGRIVESKKYPA